MDQHWIAAWGCPIARPTHHTAQWMHDITVRFTMYMTVSGSALRFHFSNLFGSNEAVITRASVAAYQGERAIDTDRLATITFNGNESGTMAPTADICSDEIPFAFQAGETLSVSLYFGGFAQMTTGHSNSGAYIEKWAVEGDFTHAATLPVNDNMAADAFPFIHTVDALCDGDAYSVIAFGDSITAQTWPDRLSRRLSALGKENVAVVRKAISGSRVLREYPCTQYYGYGPKGLDRFEREVLRAGVKKVYILHGINDIIHPDGSYFRPLSDLPTAQELIKGLQYYIDTAHAHGIEVYLAPILPFQGWRTYNEEKDAIRIAVNNWIYQKAQVEGVLPFEAAVRDPKHPLCMQAAFDSGDHLHPSADGARAMADCIPEAWL